MSSSTTNFSFEYLVDDTEKVLEALIKDSSDSFEVFLVGHSLGASIIAALPNKFKNDKINLSGLVMIDIIEGSSTIIEYC